MQSATASLSEEIAQLKQEVRELRAQQSTSIVAQASSQATLDTLVTAVQQLRDAQSEQLRQLASSLRQALAEDSNS